MVAEMSNLYQSGEKVSVSGIYRLVEKTLEGETGTLLTLHKGHYFPEHDSRGACWILMREVPDKPATAPLHTPWQPE